MAEQPTRDWRYLDTEADRHALIADIRRVRAAVAAWAAHIPIDKHTEPRYHGWSLCAMLAHLQMVDTFALLQIQLALIGIAPPLSIRLVNRVNDISARFFRQRSAAATLSAMAKQETRITNLILQLPLDRISRSVWHPPSHAYLTVERAFQAYYLFHWGEHLATLRKVDGQMHPPNLGRA